MVEKKWYENVIEIIGLTVGVFLLSIGLVFFLEPNTIASGGVTGFGIALKELIDIPVYLTNLIINIPLFIIGVLVLGKEFGWKTLYSTALLSLFLKIIPSQAITQDMLLSGLYGGLVSGLGLGIVFKSGGTTGGTDLAGSIINKFFPTISVSSFMMGIDLLVVVFAGIVTKNLEVSFYSIIALYTTVKMIDLVLEGFGYLKAFLIITDKPEEIGTKLMKDINRGVTLFSGKGMYTKEHKDVLLCIVNRSQFAKTKDVVNDVDSTAFIMVIDVSEALGEGFEKIK